MKSLYEFRSLWNDYVNSWLSEFICIDSDFFIWIHDKILIHNQISWRKIYDTNSLLKIRRIQQSEFLILNSVVKYGILFIFTIHTLDFWSEFIYNLNFLHSYNWICRMIYCFIYEAFRSSSVVSTLSTLTIVSLTVQSRSQQHCWNTTTAVSFARPMSFIIF